MSSVKLRADGMTLTAPGIASIRPTVATRSRRLAGRPAPPPASFRRRPRGVLAQPHRHRAGVAGDAGHVDGEAATRRRSRSRPRPAGPRPGAPAPARCAPRHSPARPPFAAPRPGSDGLQPNCCSASRTLTPSASSASSAAGSSVPATAREPVSVTGKAHPFLVAEGQHLDREGQPLAAAWSSATAAIAAITPKLPSYLPALRTVSMCEPEQQRRQAGLVALVAPDDVADGVDRASCRPPPSRPAPAARRPCATGKGRAGELTRFVGEPGQLVEPVDGDFACRFAVDHGGLFPAPGSSSCCGGEPSSAFVSCSVSSGRQRRRSAHDGLLLRPRSSRASVTVPWRRISLT